MRICFVMLPIEYYSPVSGGAISTITYYVARELEMQGHEIYVLCAFDGQPHYGCGLVLPVFGGGQTRMDRLRDWMESRLRRWEWYGYGRFCEDVKKRLRALAPEVVVFSNDLLAMEWARTAVAGARLGVWLHNICRPRRSVRRSLAACDFFITCSAFLRGWYLREYPLSAGKVWTVHAGVDAGAYRPAAKRTWNELRVLFVGRLDFNKGLDVAVDVVAKLKKNGLEVKLTVAGSGWFHPGGIFSGDYVERMRPVLQDASLVEWLGHVPRRWIPEVMRQNDVCVVLSRSEEPFGLVVLEAMASGLTVITSGRGGLPESAGGAAIELSEPSIEELERTLLFLSANPTTLVEHRQRGLQRIETASWKRTACEFLKVVAPGEEGLEPVYEKVGV